MSAILIIAESAFYFIALLAGIYAYRYLPPFFRLILLQVGLNCANYTLTYAITIYNRHMGTHAGENNHWLFNIYLILECTLLLAASCYLLQRWLRRYLIAGYGIFLLVFLYQVATAGFRSFAFYAACVEGILVVVAYLPILYLRFTMPGTIWYKDAYSWTAPGMVLYFACFIPYISMFGFLQRHSPVLFVRLYTIILVLENLRYLFTAIGFLLCRKSAGPVISLAHE